MSAHQLRHHADQLDALAKESRRLADELTGLPNPVGAAIFNVAAMLARHGLCVVSRDALKDVAALVATVEVTDDEPWPAGLCASVAAVQEALDRPRSPVPPTF